jgi:hypothetical protein
VSHVEEMVATIILNRIRPKTEEILSEAQAGFRPGRSTVDELFSLRFTKRKVPGIRQRSTNMLCRFPKSFDSVWRNGLQQIMRHLGYDREVIRILENLYSETKSVVRTGSKAAVSSWFETLVGVLQGFRK